MEESDNWDLSALWDTTNYYDHDQIYNLCKHNAHYKPGVSEPVSDPPPTFYELMTRNHEVKAMADKHEVVREALKELEVLIKLHENVDTE